MRASSNLSMAAACTKLGQKWMTAVFSKIHADTSLGFSTGLWMLLPPPCLLLPPNLPVTTPAMYGEEAHCLDPVHVDRDQEELLGVIVLIVCPCTCITLTTQAYGSSTKTMGKTWEFQFEMCSTT